MAGCQRALHFLSFVEVLVSRAHEAGFSTELLSFEEKTRIMGDMHERFGSRWKTCA